MLTGGTIAAAVVLVPALLAAQDAVLLRQAAPAVVVLRQAVPELPAEAGSWVLEVTTTGGVLGTGAGVPTVTIVSNGQVTCAAPDCARTVGRRDLRRLDDLLGAAVRGDVWPRPPDAFAVSLCSDCLRTVVTLSRRDGQTIVTRQASWDATQQVPPALRELAAAALRLAAAR